MFNIQIEEIKANRPLTPTDVGKMTYYVRQTFQRYTLMIEQGYLAAEEMFQDPNNDTTFVKPFDPESDESIRYTDCVLGRNLELIRFFCWDASHPKAFIAESGMAHGAASGGLNDFLFETLPPCLAYQTLAKSGVMETLYSGREIHWLLIHFFAKLKLVYGDLFGSDTPDLDMAELHLHALGIHPEHFSFRELTLLSGYKTERAIRNLASPSTPGHRRLEVIKEGRNTFIKASEARRWIKKSRGEI